MTTTLARLVVAVLTNEDGRRRHSLFWIRPPSMSIRKPRKAALTPCRSRQFSSPSALATTHRSAPPQTALWTATRDCDVLKMVLIVGLQMCFDAILCKNTRQPRVYKAFGTRSGTCDPWKKNGGIRSGCRTMSGRRRMHSISWTTAPPATSLWRRLCGSSVREVASTHGNISFKDVLLFYQGE